MHAGLTIACICKGETHPTVVNYRKFGKKYWDDGPKTFSKKGYYLAYYFQKEHVFIHQIIEIVQPADRPADMDWNSDRPILCLSEQLKAFTWDEWIHGPGKGAPYTPNYHMLPTTAWSYSELQTKFNTFQFIQFKDTVVIAPVEAALKLTEDEDEEECRLLEQLKANRVKKAQREAAGKIEELRHARGVIIRDQIAALQSRLQTLTEELAKIERGDFDADLIAGIVAQAEQIQISPIGTPTKKVR